ncbi:MULTISPECIES: hypothetical protein [Thermomonosporaceae]|uniref:hypothetical protein n=1 Tax=Thermomonosporaceae TaxID=2012 RepID=UPI00255AE7A7|nr:MULTISPECIES: hypothetical protein [Thermomonosporaceae]MDL4773988.1 hypothetical protein [Actinomadura xylanilytica]
MTAPPPWVDDLFPFPTPPGLARLVDIAWADAFTDEDEYDEALLATHYDFMFDLEAAPGAPDGWEYAYPGPSLTKGVRQDHVPMFATPELVQFGHLGNGTCVGWVVPAPELRGTDHPVALFGQEPGARIIGADTRAGLEWMLSLGLRKKNLRDDDRALIARLATELDLHPTPEHGITPDGFDTIVPLELTVPAGWRHEPDVNGAGVGVLAPAGAFTDRGHMYAGGCLDEILAHTDRLLDTGYPATALLELTDAFHDDHDRFTHLHPLWARAYHDLDRPQLATRLETMLPMYAPLQH